MQLHDYAQHLWRTGTLVCLCTDFRIVVVESCPSFLVNLLLPAKKRHVLVIDRVPPNGFSLVVFLCVS